MKSVSLLFVLGIGSAAVAGACGSNPPPQQQATPQPNADSAAAAERARQDSIDAARRAADEAERVRRQREADSLAALSRSSDEVKSTLAAMIHFDYDKANIRSDDMGTLDQKVAILQANPDVHIRIGGHCDERGSDEYNLALGNRRAQAAKQYLVAHGIDGGRIETQSWGEEKPLAQGHDESAWSQNRRDEFEITSGGDNLKRP